MTGISRCANQSEPRLLIVLLSGTWHGVARLPKELTLSGFHVATLCPGDSFLAKTRFVERTFLLHPQESAFPYLVEAIRIFKPDWLIAGCELAVQLFHEILRAGADGRLADRDHGDVLALVQQSLGKPEYFSATLSKHENQDVAAKLGLRVPLQTHVASSEDAARVADSYGYPVVLKSEFGHAGKGVRIGANRAEATQAFNELTSSGHHPRIFVQQFVQGALGMGAAVAVDGTVLECVSALKVHCYPSETSPCSVMKFIENEDIEASLALLIKAYGFTGFCSGDFMIESGTNSAYLLEFNPRPVPLSNFSGLSGRSLCRALYCYFSGAAYQRNAPRIDHGTVALFPNEWARDPQSRLLQDAYHDVPWDDPSLLKTIIDSCRWT
jgi:hypothetical protein